MSVLGVELDWQRDGADAEERFQGAGPVGRKIRHA